MKKVLGLIMLIAIVFTAAAQEPTNYLRLKGKVLKDYKTTVQVFEYDNDTERWSEIVNKDNRSSYSLRLSTRKDYKIFFQSDRGQSKVIEIKSGSPGMWVEKIDIDFDRINATYLTMKQRGTYNPYEFVTKENCSYTDIAAN